MNKLPHQEYFTGTLVVVFIAWITVPLFFGGFCSYDLERASRFGDSFGSVSALFTGLALAASSYAIILQWLQMRAANDAAASNEGLFAASIKLDALTYLVRDCRERLESIDVVKNKFGPNCRIPVDAQIRILKYDLHLWKHEKERLSQEIDRSLGCSSHGPELEAKRNLEFKRVIQIEMTNEALELLHKLSDYEYQIQCLYELIKLKPTPSAPMPANQNKNGLDEI